MFLGLPTGTVVPLDSFYKRFSVGPRADESKYFEANAWVGPELPMTIVDIIGARNTTNPLPQHVRARTGCGGGGARVDSSERPHVLDKVGGLTAGAVVVGLKPQFGHSRAERMPISTATGVMQTARRGAAATAVVGASDERRAKLMSKLHLYCIAPWHCSSCCTRSRRA